MKSQNHIENLRSFELSKIRKFLPDIKPDTRPTIIDIGAGSGYQAAQLEALGYNVIAFDLEDSAYKNDRVFPVCIYDGTVIPIKTGSVDAIFSSNVLEHVPDVENLLNEMRRVLSPGGYAIHIVPTPSWRFWTTLMHYPWGIKRLICISLGAPRKTTSTNDQDQIVEKNLFTTIYFHADMEPVEIS